jgi:hypothetical protein
MSKDRPPFGVPGAGAGEEGGYPPAGTSDEQEAHAARAANRFDIRRVIGAVFVVYGILLIALGLFGSSTIKHKAAGINIDLWSGLGMLVFGLLMIGWALLRPVRPEPEETRGQGSGRIRRAPAT